jgi:hypothetical membrane protein
MKFTRYLLHFGIFTPLSFWAITLVAGHLHGSYNHLRDTVSALGQLGSHSEQFMGLATFGLALGSALFSVGFYRASRRLRLSVAPAVLSFAMVVSFVWASVFPAGHPQHAQLGWLPILSLLSTLVAAVSWLPLAQGNWIRGLSALSFGVMMLFFVRFFPTIEQQYMGLAQRFLWLGWSIWWVSIAIQFNKMYLKSPIDI